MSIINEALKKAQEARKKQNVSKRQEEKTEHFRTIVSHVDQQQAEALTPYEVNYQEVSEEKIEEKLRKPQSFIDEYFRGDFLKITFIAGSIVAVVLINIILFIKLTSTSQPVYLRDAGIIQQQVAQSEKTAPEGAPRDISYVKQRYSYDSLSPVSKFVNIISFWRSDYHCSGIIYDNTAPIAIINGIVVEEGDLIGGAVVGRINNNEVILKKKRKRYVVPLSA